MIQEVVDESVDDTENNTVDQINAGGNAVINLGNPINNNDAATKYYVDTKCGLNVLKVGDTMSGNLDMDDNKIVNLREPTNLSDASSKNYVDNQSSLKVSKSGDSMSGTLNMGSNRIIGLPTSILDASSDGDAVSKKIMVDLAGDLQNTCLLKQGGTMYGQINMNSNKIVNLSDPTNGQDAASKYYIDTVLGGYLSKFGTEAQGDVMLSIAADAVRNLGCNNINTGKTFNLYLGDNDNYIRYAPNLLSINSSAGILFTDNGNVVMSTGVSNSNFNAYFYQNVNMSLNRILNMADPSLDQDASTKKYSDDGDNLRVFKGGDTMSGVLNMGNSQITNVSNPMNGGDAANKAYVDSKLIKNSGGLIPHLSSNTNNRCGISVQCTQEYNNQFQSYLAFSFTQAATNSEFACVTTPTYPVIMNISLQNAASIWQIGIRGRVAPGAGYFNEWQLRASNDAITYVTLINSTTILDNNVKYFNVSPVNTNAFKYFQLYFTSAATGNSPGLSWCQLYHYDSLY